MAEQKEPQLTSSYEPSKTTTAKRTVIYENDKNLPEKIVYNKRHKEGTTVRQDGWTYNIIKPDTHNILENILHRFSYRSERSEPYIGLPSLQMTPQGFWLRRPTGLNFRSTPGLREIETSFLKGTRTDRTCSRIRTKAII